MRKALGWLSILVWAALCLTVTGAAQDAKKTSPPPKKTAKKTTTGKSSAKKTPAGKSTAKKSSKSGKKTAPRTSWRNRQTAPTSERYKQIQDALVAKGFLGQEEANGAWGESSVDALKRFQASQNIESSGKVDSLSLIALGLGPRHDDAPPKPPEPAAPPSPPQAQ